MKQTIIYIGSAFISLALFLGLVFVFGGNGEEISLGHFNPIASINGLAFAFAFGLGVPVWLSFILAGLMIFGIPLALFYCLKRGLSRMLK